ncbi:MAG: glycosyltransferase family 39 protein [Candidatus Omnitrophica bacterium]|jgi:4-amino-4-deoxy-L-arabinose transferase-like glycosyltransferase|nr:glycosyltransferase family 39 protein [Candidatus Omnitrophota bacterium]
MTTLNIFSRIFLLVVLSYFCFRFCNWIIGLTNFEEVYYAQSAKEMIQLKSWLTPYLFGQPQMGNSILFYWLLKSAFMLFGASSFSARFFPALFAIVGVIALFLLGVWGFKDQRKAFICAIVLMTSLLYLMFSRMVFPDLIFSVFILLSLTSFYLSFIDCSKKGWAILLFFVFAALAVLTNGIFGLIIPLAVASVFLLINKQFKFIFNRFTAWGAVIFFFITFPRYFLLNKFYADLSSNGLFYGDYFKLPFSFKSLSFFAWNHYPLFIAASILPWSLFFICALALLPKQLQQKNKIFYSFLISWLIVVLVIPIFGCFRSLGYLFLLLPAVALITGGYIARELLTKKTSRLFDFVSWTVVLIILLIPAVLSLVLAGFTENLSIYLPIKLVAYLFIPSFLCLAIAAFIFLLNRNKKLCFYCFAFILPLFLCLFPFVSAKLEPYFSTQTSCKYLLEHFQVNNTLLVAKPYLLGVKFYTDKEVAGIDLYNCGFSAGKGKLFLTTRESLLGFLRKQNLTYCLLDQRSFNDLQQFIHGEFSCSILEIKAKIYIVKIEKLL